MSSTLEKILLIPDLVDAVLCKVLTKNDDSGRHGVLVPAEAYRMFPDISGFDPNVPVNYTEDIITLWCHGVVGYSKDSRYKHYHRYPERRLTRLENVINGVPDNTIFVAARRTDMESTYEIHMLDPLHPLYENLLNELGIPDTPGTFFLDLEWAPDIEISRTESIDDLLVQFDRVSSSGFIKTMRSGSTGVGYTFETMLGIEENNYQGPDYKGIELKCFRIKGANRDEKKNLFLKEPEWIDSSKGMNDRLERYGYFDHEQGRKALFSAVTINENSHNLRLRVDDESEFVYLEYNEIPVARYSFAAIESRLVEKLTETVFIGAVKRGKGNNEEFNYATLTHYTGPSIKQFISLIKSGHVMLEIRMRDGKNYGSCFRVMGSKLPELYSRTEHLRG